MWKGKRNSLIKIMLKMKTKIGGIIQPNFKTYIATIIKIV